jgi:hypothetical protein
MATPSPAQLVGGGRDGCAARAVEPAQQGRSSRVALGSRPLRSLSGSEWRSRLVPALFDYALLAQALVTNKHCGEREIAPGDWQHKDLEQCKLSQGVRNSLLRPTHFLSFPTTNRCSRLP